MRTEWRWNGVCIIDCGEKYLAWFCIHVCMMTHAYRIVEESPYCLCLLSAACCIYSQTSMTGSKMAQPAVLIEKPDVLRVRYTMRAFAHICLQSVLVAEHVVPLRVSAMTHVWYAK